MFNQTYDQDELDELNNVFMPRIPSSQYGSSQGSQPFGRQDSLAMCSSLQERDRIRDNEEIMRFMETEMDIEPYIETLKQLEVPENQIQLDDNELVKAKILDPDYYSSDHMNHSENYHHRQPMQQTHDYDPYADLKTPNNGAEQDSGYFEHEIHSVSSNYTRSSTPNFPNNHGLLRMPKIEPLEDHEAPSTSAAIFGNRMAAARSTHTPMSMSEDMNMSYTPKTKARKYELKPDAEKSKPTYKIKRARNNDAVRKSRNKTKELQAQKEEKLHLLTVENERLQSKLNQYETEKKIMGQQIQQLKTENHQFRAKINQLLGGQGLRRH